MKVLVGQFVTESNANIPVKNEISNYQIAFGEDCINKMRIRQVFEDAGIEIIPSIFADAGASGVIKKDTYHYIEACFVNAVKEHIDEVDGIYLMLHGAGQVDGMGSADHMILKAIREVTGDYLPICVCCDPHGNLCREYVEATQVIRSYRQSPHTDSTETMKKVAGMLCDLLKDRQNIHSVYRKLPLILGGEQSVSADEPVKSINIYMDEAEKDSRIRSISWHVGYIRHDTPVAGCGIVVVPMTERDQAYAEEVADRVASCVWEKRHEFHYTGLTAMPDDALKMALEFDGKPVFITDSGDNTTSGATGWNTYILRQVMAVENLRKRFLFANITDPDTYLELAELKPGTEAHISLGMNHDEMSKSVELDVVVKTRGKMLGYMMHPRKGDYGYCVLVEVKGTPIEINIATERTTMSDAEQYAGVGIDWDEYDVIVVKQGYIFPELKAKGKKSVMSLTNGATPQNTKTIPFKRIMRPMYPIDEI